MENMKIDEVPKNVYTLTLPLPFKSSNWKTENIRQFIAIFLLGSSLESKASSKRKLGKLIFRDIQYLNTSLYLHYDHDLCVYVHVQIEKKNDLE